jgi:hypothetical protein
MEKPDSGFQNDRSHDSWLSRQHELALLVDDMKTYSTADGKLTQARKLNLL